MDNWNDLKLVLAIHRCGSLTAGARLLGINHSTAYRRLKALEVALGARLFDRLPAGRYVATAVGMEAVSAAKRVEAETSALSREIMGADAILSGPLRITCSETLAYQVLPAELARFCAIYPAITVEVIVDNEVLDLEAREADIAIRINRPKDEQLIGRKIIDAPWAIYGGKRLLADCVSQAGPRDLKLFPFVSWPASATDILAARWIVEEVAPTRIPYRSNSLLSQMSAARENVGLALLPCYLGDAEDALLRVLPNPITELSRELWMVTHADLRNTGRVRALFDTVGASLARKLQVFTGGLT